MKTTRQLALAGLAFGLLLAWPVFLGLAPAAEDNSNVDGLDAATKSIAKHFAQLIADEGINAVDVREFDSRENAGTGLGVSQSIITNLKASGVNVQAAADAAVLQGRFRLADHKPSGRKCIVIEARLTDAEGNGIGDSTEYVLTDEKALQTLLPSTGALPLKPSVSTDGSDQEIEINRIQAIVQNFLVKDPPPQQAAENGVVFRPTTDSPFGIEILVLRDNEYVSAPISTSSNGETIVSLSDNDIYAVRLVNDDQQFAAGVTLSIDGVNSLAFSGESFRQVGKWVVAAGASNAQVRGWHQRDGETRSFKVTDFGKSVAGKAGVPQPRAGIISASFCVAVPADGGKLPTDEPTLSVAARGELATGEGPLVEQKAEPVAMVFGVTRATVSIRYVPEFAADLPAPQ